MDREQFERHSFAKDETVLHAGKPVRVVSVSPHSLTIQLGQNHFKTVLPAEVELIDGRGCEFR